MAASPDGVPRIRRSKSAKSATSSSPPLDGGSTPIQPARSSISTNCMAAPATDSPPNTPTSAGRQPKPASALSLRQLLRRASRAIRRTVGSGRRKSKGARESVESAASNTGSAMSMDEKIADDVSGRRSGAKHEDLDEVVPEKIIQEDESNSSVVNHQEEDRMSTPGVETAPASAEEEDDVKKPAAPAPAVAAAVADKFVVAVTEDAATKREKAIQEEVARRFLGSRVRTAMEKRSEEEEPRKRETPRSGNDVIEETRTKLLEERNGNVKALVGAFETVLDTISADAATPKSSTSPSEC